MSKRSERYVYRDPNAALHECDRQNFTRAEIRHDFLFSSNDLSSLCNLQAFLLDNPDATTQYEEEIRFMAGRSGEQNTHEKFHNTIQRAIDSYHTSKSLSCLFVPSDLYSIRVYDNDILVEEIDEDVNAKCQALRSDIEYAIEVGQKGTETSFDSLFRQGEDALRHERDILLQNKKKYEELNNSKALYGIEKKLEIIDRILTGSVLDFIRMTKKEYEVIAGLKLDELDRLMRVGAFARAISRSIATRYIAAHIPSADVDQDTIIAVNSFVDHTIKQVDYSDYFTSDTSKALFDRSINTIALREHLSVNNRRARDEQQIQFIPSRTLGLYFSGATGDSCLDGSEKNLSEIYPNVTALSILRNPGQRTERIVGSCLVMETIDAESGEPIYVIRAINPIVNFINNASVEDFYRALTEYVKQCVGGDKVAVIIDSNGQASTNRPVIASYLEDVVKRCPSNRRLSLLGDNRFEHYPIDDKHPAYFVS